MTLIGSSYYAPPALMNTLNQKVYILPFDFGHLFENPYKHSKAMQVEIDWSSWDIQVEAKAHKMCIWLTQGICPILGATERILRSGSLIYCAG